MGPKRKMIVSISVIAFVVLAVVTSVISVLAAQKTEVSEVINIEFESYDVYGSAEISWQLGSLEPEQIGSLTFDESTTPTGYNSATSMTVDMNKVATSVDSPITFFFKFKKEDEGAYVENFSVAILFSGNVKNVKVTVYNGTSQTEFSNNSKVAVTYSKDFVPAANCVEISNAENWQVISIKVEALDPLWDASFNGTFTCILNNIDD